MRIKGTGYSGVSREQEYELGKRIQAGDTDAITELVEVNLGYVMFVAKKYMKHGTPFDDLVGYGVLGAMEAAKRFDPDLGYKFCVYADHHIRNEIRKGLAIDSRRPVVLGTNAAWMTSKIRRITDDLTKKLGRTPTAEEISAVVDDWRYPPEFVANVVNADISPVRLDGKAYNDEDSNMTLQDMLEGGIEDPERYAEMSLNADLVDEMMSCLKAKERQVVCMRHGIGYDREYNYREIGEAMGYTKQRVHQIEQRAFKVLRQYYNLKDLIAVTRG